MDVRHLFAWNALDVLLQKEFTCKCQLPEAIQRPIMGGNCREGVEEQPLMTAVVCKHNITAFWPFGTFFN
jgi:hypothetical protein